MQFKEIHLKLPINACKMFQLFFFLSFFFLLIITDKVVNRCLCRQYLQICVLKITQNNTSYPKSRIINYIIIEILVLIQCSWSVVMIQACFYSKIARNWVYKQSLQICVLQIMQNNTSHPKSLIMNHVIIWIIFERILTD